MEATLIKYIGVVAGHAYQALYKVSPPIQGCEYVVCSSAKLGTILFETQIFPANCLGEIINFSELPGSQKFTMSHAKVLNSIGYEIMTENM